MNRIRSLVVAVAIAGALAGCSKPTDAIIPTDLSKIDGEFSQKIKSLSDEDKQLLTAYLMRVKLGEAFGGKPMPVGTTVGQAIEDQKKFAAQKASEEAAQEQLKKQLEEQKAAAAAKIGNSVVLAFLGQRFSPSDFSQGRYDDQFVIEIGVKNAGEKAIKGIKGDLVLKNTFGEVISKTTVNIEEEIPPGASYTWTGSRKLNKFDDDDKKLMGLEDGKFSTELRPTMVVYADGTTVGTP
ncbi:MULTISPECIES: hypothetical protein [Burkholderia cepacia complex]|nr:MULTISPECIES: hypothetical protein [Burkholderia cepacia complex]